MRVYGDQNMSWQALRDVVRGQARYWPDGRVNAVYPNGDGARWYGTSTALYPEWLWRYYVSTGDTDTAVPHYTSPPRWMWLWSARQGGTGLLYGLGDTSNGDPVYGYDLSVAADTASNVLAVNAFHRVAQLATLAGDASGAATWRARATQLAAAVNAVLRRPDGTYVDGVDANGAQSQSRSQEANALPLAYGVVPAADVQAVASYVASLGIDLGPNHGLELLRALAAADRPDAMVHTLTDASIPGWAHIVAVGGTFTWEEWRPSDLIGDSMSHGWGSSGLVAIQESLLGVSFMEPNPDGTVRVSVAPPSSGLSRASGSVPTVAGPVSVAWQRRGGGMALELDVPSNASALVHLPTTNPSSVREGGMPADGPRCGGVLALEWPGAALGGKRELPLHVERTLVPLDILGEGARGLDAVAVTTTVMTHPTLVYLLATDESVARPISGTARGPRRPGGDRARSRGASDRGKARWRRQRDGDEDPASSPDTPARLLGPNMNADTHGTRLACGLASGVWRPSSACWPAQGRRPKPGLAAPRVRNSSGARSTTPSAPTAWRCTIEGSQGAGATSTISSSSPAACG